LILPYELAAGRFSYQPGEEMQHDTSPHMLEVAGIFLAYPVYAHSHNG
jgi:hypothetical protein